LPFTDGTFNSIYVPFVQNGIGFYHSNLLPLMLTAGIMGFLDIPLKPSTILVFGIAFGLSVDDTVRFLSQYREELKKTTGKYANLFMQHLQMPLEHVLYSIVLFLGLCLMLSSFGGTIALGGLISLTLLFECYQI
jgi:predicted RND superfamily exporter protein